VIDPPADKLREAGLLADALLHIEAARQYGFRAGGPKCNVERCEILRDMAHAAGHTWTQEEMTAMAQSFIKEFNGTPAS
jgi:hypothetical protein